jgi:3-deoxy-7-phosphoheptulonate synthase
MIVVLKKGASIEEVNEITEWVKNFGVRVDPIYGSETIVLGLVGDTFEIDKDALGMINCVEKVILVQEPYKRANIKFHPDRSIISAGSVKFGGTRIPIIAGPCSVESEAQIIEIANKVKEYGATLLRGGAYKPRSSPYSFQGLESEGLDLLDKARKATGLPIVSEITSTANIQLFSDYVDVIQVGSRNMQNFELLKQLGLLRKPILLKRGFSNTIEELLMSAEYIMNGGNENVILCERGIRTFETYTRNTLDVSAIPILKKHSHLPVIVDPSHAAGMSYLVEPLALAAIACGADGLLIEVHQDPKNALSDGAQSITPKQFEELMPKMEKVANAVGRTIY